MGFAKLTHRQRGLLFLLVGLGMVNLLVLFWVIVHGTSTKIQTVITSTELQSQGPKTTQPPNSPTVAQNQTTPTKSNPATTTHGVLAATTNVPVPTSGAYWGTYKGDPNSTSTSLTSSQRQGFINDVEAKIGRKYDYDRQFYKWGDNPFAANPTPNDYLKWSSTTGGHYMHINLVATNRTSGFTSWANIASGSQDAYLHTLASDIKSWGKPAFFTFHHEPESKICPNDTSAGCDTSTYYGTTADYKNAWRHIVQVFRNDGVNNLSYAWLTGFYRWSYPSDYRYGASNYPGDDVIDWIGVDPFNFVIPFNTTPDYGDWKDLSTLINSWYSWSAPKGKPLMLGAWGSIEDPSQPTRRAAWFNTARSDLKSKYPQVKALLSYDTYPPDNLSDTRIFNGTQASIDAYTAWGIDSYFNTRNCTVSNCPGPTPPTSGQNGNASTPKSNATSTNASNASNSNAVSDKDKAPDQTNALLTSSKHPTSSTTRLKPTINKSLRYGLTLFLLLAATGSFTYGTIELLKANHFSFKAGKLHLQF